MPNTVLSKRIIAMVCSFTMLFVSCFSGLMVAQAKTEDYVLDLKGLTSAGMACTTVTQNADDGTATVDYEGMLVLNWMAWDAGVSGAVDFSDYSYLTMTVKFKDMAAAYNSNPYAQNTNHYFSLHNEGGVAFTANGEVAAVNTADLQSVAPSDEWTTISLPIGTASNTAFYYLRTVVESCGTGTMYIKDMRLTEDDRTPVSDYVLDLQGLGAGNGATTASYDETTGISKIDYSGQMWLYWEPWKTDAWATSQSAIDISKYKYLTMTVQMTTGNPFAVAASPIFNLCNDGGQAINNPWTGATVNTAGLKALSASEDWVTVSLPLDTTNLQSFFYAIILCDSCGAGSLSVKDMRLTEDDRTPVSDYVLDLQGLGAGNGATTASYDETTGISKIDYSGQMWLYWEPWKTDAWATSQSAIDISKYKYLTMTVQMTTGNPFAVAASPIFNLCNDGGQAINNPWTGATVNTAGLKALSASEDWVTVSLPLDTTSLSSFFYAIILCDSCGAGSLSIKDMRLTEDDRGGGGSGDDSDSDSPINAKGEYVLDLSAAFGSGNGANGGIFTYDDTTKEATVVFDGQFWAYWTLWDTSVWAKDQSPIDISDYNYLTMKVKLENGNNPFAQTANPIFNLVNDGGKAINNPWTGVQIGTAKLEAVATDDDWVTLSLPIEISDLSSFYYFVMLCDMCGSGTMKFADMRLTSDDYTDDAFKNIKDDTADSAGKLLANAWSSGYDSTTVTTDAQTGVVTVDYDGMLWLYWKGWNAKGYTGSAYPIGDYKYLTMTMKMTDSNPFATSNDSVFNLCNDGGVAINNPDKGASVQLDLLKKVAADGEWFTVSLPIDSSVYTDYYYAMLRAQNCGVGQFQMKDICLTADDRTNVYTGEPWDDSYGYWLQATGWGNGYPQGSTFVKDITNDTLNVSITGQPMYSWSVWDTDAGDNAVVDLSDYKYLTFQVKMNGGNPFSTAKEKGTTVGFFVCDEGGKQITDPWSFGSAVLDNICAVKTSDEWVTVSLSLKDVEQSTMRYIYLCAENVGDGYGFAIRNMCLTATDKTTQAILDRVAADKETNDPNAEDEFNDPEDTLDNYTNVSGGSAGTESQDKTDSQDKADTPNTGETKYPVVAVLMAMAAILGGRLILIRKKRI